MTAPESQDVDRSTSADVDAESEQRLDTEFDGLGPSEDTGESDAPSGTVESDEPARS